MAITVSGQGEPNRSLGLATRASKMELSCLLGTTHRVPREKFSRKPNNKSFIDQACLVKAAGYWPRSFFCEFMDLDIVLVHNTQKKNLANIQPSLPPAILTEQACPITHVSVNPCFATFCVLFWCFCVGEAHINVIPHYCIAHPHCAWFSRH